ncbi:MAG: carboxypeptidase-like regulatory domain-containing protein [Bacteroides sp.]|nr:carboxypeptidase-like regulatory domain-containing protein [Bacteroides sp.]
MTDYGGQPIDSASVWWQNPQFDNVVEVATDKDGCYTARVPEGKYKSVASIYFPSYAHTALKSGLPEAEHRLEFWVWDFIADRDTTLDIRYNRMEVYGLRAFSIPGAMPAYQIYVRPMSLTRTYEWMKTAKPSSIVHGEDLSGIQQEAQSKEARECQWAPHSDQLKATVWIDGEEVPILMKQEIKEYYEADEYGNAYLLTVDLPKHPKKGLPYLVFKVELTDLENGDRGEGLYYMEKAKYVK